MTGFFTTTFETYTTHHFHLHQFNAVNEGMLIILFNVLITVFVGPEWWNNTFFGIKRNTLFNVGLYISGLVFIFKR